VCTDSNLEDGESSTQEEAIVQSHDAPAKVEDPDTIEVLLDPVKLIKSGASGDAQSSSSEPSVRSSDSRGGTRLWQRIRRQWRDFRFRFARRFSRVFTRRGRYQAPATPSQSDQVEATAAD